MESPYQHSPVSGSCDAGAVPLGFVTTSPPSPESGVAQRRTPSSRVARPETVTVWGTDFARLTMEETVMLADDIVAAGHPEHLVTANLNYLMLTAEHPVLATVNQSAAAVVADGNPIVWRSRFTARPLPCRVAGSDLIKELAQLAAARGYRVFFLGGQEGVASGAASALQRQFPGLQVAGCYAPPFRTLNSAEHTQLINRIRGAKTDILLVAFGQPKGEIWIHENQRELGVPLSIQLGASFDFLAGTAQRAPQIWQACACEWLYRASCDPRRLVPRYARNAAFLARCVFRECVRRNASSVS